jgi:hypothetical protein
MDIQEYIPTPGFRMQQYNNLKKQNRVLIKVWAFRKSCVKA